MVRYIIGSSVLVILLVIIISCANMSSALKGGTKDVTPPKLVYSVPELNARNFRGRKIEITFDEFLTVTNIGKELVISPPLKKKPTITQRSKSIYIILDDKDTLKTNTTYTFYFGNSVKDLNEGNALKNFEFVFSTGDKLDSLSLRGKVLSSFDLVADKDKYYVMLYDKFEDSIPRKTLPSYVTQTDEKGYFTLNHLRADSFMIFALKDANQNLLFDLPAEIIGFSDTVIKINENYFVPKDTMAIDTAKFDSLRNVLPNLKPQIELFTFEEDHKKQYLSKYNRSKPYKFNLSFNHLPYDSVNINLMDYDSNNWYISDLKVPQDSITYWITDTTLIHKDTLKTIITYSKLDSIGQKFSYNDTILLCNKKIIGTKQPKKDIVKKKVNEFKIQSAINQSDVDLNKKVYVSTSFPVKSIDRSKIKFYKLSDNEDKRKIPVNFSLLNDTSCIRDYWLKFLIEPATEYYFIADSAALLSIYNQFNDSTCIHFKSQKDDYYGTLKLNLSNVTGHIIVQVIGGRDAVVDEKYTDADGPVLFNFLKPGKYRIKIIYDRNHNNVWDTGNFRNHIQPERVDYYKDVITIRSNWDLTETWKLK